MEKTDRIFMACTPDQKRILKDAASKVGLTLSGYLMFCAFERMGESIGDHIASAVGSPSCAGCVHVCIGDDGKPSVYPCSKYEPKKK